MHRSLPGCISRIIILSCLLVACASPMAATSIPTLQEDMPKAGITPSPQPSPTVTSTPEPTPIPLPVGSEAQSGLVEGPTGLPSAEALVSQAMLLKPLGEVPELAGVDFDYASFDNLKLNLSKFEVLAATNGAQGDLMIYTLVVTARDSGGNRVVVIADKITIGGTEYQADYLSYFDAQADGRVTLRTDGVSYSKQAVGGNEPLAVNWNGEYPSLVRAPFGDTDAVYGLVWSGGEWVVNPKTEGMNWDGVEWKLSIPALPEWATEYTGYHAGVYEKIGDKQYYTSEKSVEVNGETRNIKVKLLEYDATAKEWVPSYETVEEILKSRQLMILFKLNQITSPEQAVWMIREGETIETEQADLRRLETIFKTFAAEINQEQGQEMWPGVGPYSLTWEQLDGMVVSVNTYDSNVKVNPGQTVEIDGIKVWYPHAYVAVRRGINDQLIFGVPAYFGKTMVWYGYDQSILEKTLPDWAGAENYHTTTTEGAVEYFQNLDSKDDFVGDVVFRTPSGSAQAEVEQLFNIPGLDPGYAKKMLDQAYVFTYDWSPWTSGLTYWLMKIHKR